MKIISLTYSCASGHKPVTMHDHGAEGASFSSVKCPKCGAQMAVARQEENEHPHPSGVGHGDLGGKPQPEEGMRRNVKLDPEAKEKIEVSGSNPDVIHRIGHIVRQVLTGKT